MTLAPTTSVGIDLAWGDRASTGMAVVDAEGRLAASALRSARLRLGRRGLHRRATAPDALTPAPYSGRLFIVFISYEVCRATS